LDSILVHLRRLTEAELRGTRIVLSTSVESVHLVAQRLRDLDRVADVVTEDAEPLLVLCLAAINDASGQQCFADALRLIGRRWGCQGGRIAEVVIATRFRIGCVDAVADRLKVDRATLRRRCMKDGVASPRRVIEASRLVAAILLRHRTRASAVQIAEVMGNVDPRIFGREARTRALAAQAESLWDLVSPKAQGEQCTHLLDAVDAFVGAHDSAGPRAAATIPWQFGLSSRS
jgi:AraC-like DNA-binding protein